MSAFIDEDLLPVQDEFDIQARLNAALEERNSIAPRSRFNINTKIKNLQSLLARGSIRNVTPESLERRRVAQFKGRRSTILSLEGDELGKSFERRPTTSVLGS